MSTHPRRAVLQRVPIESALPSLRASRGCLVGLGRRAGPLSVLGIIPGALGGGRIDIFGCYPPSRTYQQHALARGCSGLSADTSRHLPLVIILRKIQRENYLRGKRESVKGEKNLGEGRLREKV